MNAVPDQLRAFVERIIRLREEVKAINGDIREVYAEAKGNGFDKTALGQVVSHVEKRAADPDKVAERSALFDLYLSAFDGVGTPVATHAHEADDHDPETGEFVDTEREARLVAAAGASPVIPSREANKGGKHDSSVDPDVIARRRLQDDASDLALNVAVAQKGEHQRPTETPNDNAPVESAADGISTPIHHEAA